MYHPKNYEYDPSDSRSDAKIFLSLSIFTHNCGVLTKPNVVHTNLNDLMANSPTSTQSANDASNQIWQQLETHRDYLFKIALQLSENLALAQDLVQDTLVSGFEKYAQFKNHSTLRTWLTRILKNRLVDHWRQSKKWIALPEESEDSLLEFDVLFNQTNHWDSGLFVEWKTPEHAASEQQFLSVVDWCITHLPPKTRQVFLMSHVLEYSTTEICTHISIQTNHLWVLLYRARLSLKLCLEQKWFKEPSRS